MATPTAEFRETLVKQGCSEAMADTIVGLAGAARDEAIERAVEQNGHSISMLTTRFESHEAQNEADLRAVMSTIRETAATITTEIKDELAKDRVLNERRFSEVQEQFAKQSAEMERRFSEQSAKTEQRFSDVRSEMEQRFTKQSAEIEQRFSAVERRFSEVMSEITGLRADVDRRIGELEHRMLVFGIGMAGLVVGVGAAVIAAVAIFAGGA